MEFLLSKIWKRRGLEKINLNMNFANVKSIGYVSVFLKRDQKMHYNNQDMTASKGKKKNSFNRIISGYRAKIDLEV